MVSRLSQGRPQDPKSNKNASSLFHLQPELARGTFPQGLGRDWRPLFGVIMVKHFVTMCLHPTLILGNILKQFQESISRLFYIHCKDFRTEKCLFAISPSVSGFIIKVFYLGTAAFICVWKGFGNGNLG